MNRHDLFQLDQGFRRWKAEEEKRARKFVEQAIIEEWLALGAQTVGNA